MEDTSRIYNAAADMADRHVAEGCADKIAFIDENGSYTCGAFQA